jgi:hypothetical protein
VEKEPAGFLAAQIEQAQRSIESWPSWLKEVIQVETPRKNSDAKPQTSQTTKSED